MCPAESEEHSSCSSGKRSTSMVGPMPKRNEEGTTLARGPTRPPRPGKEGEKRSRCVVEIEDSSDDDRVVVGDDKRDARPTRQQQKGWFASMLNDSDRLRIRRSGDTSAAWLTDNIVNAVLDFIVSCTENDKTVSSLVLKAGHLFPMSPSHAALVFGQGSVIAILHVDRIHWVCAHVDNTSRSVVVYDSVRPPVGETVALHVVQGALSAFLCTAYGTRAAEWNITYCDHNPKQDDMSSCGIFSLLVALCLTCRVPIPRQANASFWRLFFAAMVTPGLRANSLLPASRRHQARSSVQHSPPMGPVLDAFESMTLQDAHGVKGRSQQVPVRKEATQSLLQDLSIALNCVKALRANGKALLEPVLLYVGDVKSGLNTLQKVLGALSRSAPSKAASAAREKALHLLQTKADRARERCRFWGRRLSVLQSGLGDLDSSGLLHILENDIRRVEGIVD